MFCYKCGKERPDQPVACPACGAAPQGTAAPAPVYVNTASSAADHLIPMKNPPALTAYYLGVFSLIPCLGLLLGPAALFFGWSGLGKAKQIPNRVGKCHAIVGLVLGGLMTLLNYGALLSFALMSRR